VVVEGSFIVTLDGEERVARTGEVIHLSAGQRPMFRAEEDCRLVLITSPPSWRALENAWEQGLMGNHKGK